MEKILYLINQPLDSRNYNRFGIQKWVDRGWDVEIWDLTPLTYPVVWNKFHASKRKLSNFCGYYPIKSWIQLRAKITTLQGVKYFIDLASTDIYSICTIIALKLRGVVRILQGGGSIPSHKTSQRLKGRAIQAWESGPKKLLFWMISGCFRKLASKLIRPGIGIAGGIESLKYVGGAKDVINAHSLDYDTYLNIKNSTTRKTDFGVVFIDQDYCFHPDYDYVGVKSPVSPEKYFPAVVNTLKSISKHLNTMACVAAHPRSSYQNLPKSVFEDVEVKLGITGELIKDCQVVVAHNSGILQLAVLFNKPIIFISTNEFKNAEVLQGHCEAFAKSLGRRLINIDKDLDQIDWQKELVIDSKKYASYKNKYIKTNGSPEKSSWEILIDHIT